jgi:hypothetical protein
LRESFGFRLLMQTIADEHLRREKHDDDEQISDFPLP